MKQIIGKPGPVEQKAHLWLEEEDENTIVLIQDGVKLIRFYPDGTQKLIRFAGHFREKSRVYEAENENSLYFPPDILMS